MPGQRLQQLFCARHHERQDQSVRLGETERVFGSLVRRPLVTKVAVGEAGEQMSLNERDVTDDGCRAVQNVLHGDESRRRIAFREADHRAGISRLARAGPLVIEGREGGAGFAGQPNAGLGGQ